MVDYAYPSVIILIINYISVTRHQGLCPEPADRSDDLPQAGSTIDQDTDQTSDLRGDHPEIRDAVASCPGGLGAIRDGTGHGQSVDFPEFRVSGLQSLRGLQQLNATAYSAIWAKITILEEAHSLLESLSVIGFRDLMA